jgi:UDPglucose--hexose-1-phosphate uridylyltransferase
MSPSAIISVLETWINLYSSLQSSPFAYVSIFENKGLAMGSSNPHPHSQVWATSHIPHQALVEFHSLSHYRQTYKSCMLCDYVESEIQRKERIVAHKGTWVALCPYWAVWPFEILLLPMTHLSALPDLSTEAVTDLATVLSAVTTRYDNLFEIYFPYSMGIHQAPIKIPEGEIFRKDVSHLHFHFCPPLLQSTVKKAIVGYNFVLAKLIADSTC